MDTNFSTWTSGQVVTGAQMTSLTQDLYNKLGFLTQAQTPSILFIDGLITEGGGNVDIPDGYFRFANNTISQLPYQTAIFGSAPAATVAVTGDGWIVARYSVTPSLPNAINYSFPTTYVFTATTPLITDCIVCVITAGVVSGYGPFAIQNLFTYNGTTNTLTLQNPNTTPIGLATNGLINFEYFNSSVGSGVRTSLYNVNPGQYAMSAVDTSGNFSVVAVSSNGSGINEVGLAISTTGGTEVDSGIQLTTAGRPYMQLLNYIPPSSNSLLILQDIDSGNGIAKYGYVSGDDGLIGWGISISSFNPNGAHGSAILSGSIGEAVEGSPIVNSGTYGISLSELAGYLPSSLPDGGYIGTITADSSSIQWGGGCFIGSNAINIEWEFATTAPSSVTISFSMVITW